MKQPIRGATAGLIAGLLVSSAAHGYEPLSRAVIGSEEENSVVDNLSLSASFDMGRHMLSAKEDFTPVGDLTLSGCSQNDGETTRISVAGGGFAQFDNRAVDTEINNPPALMLPTSPTAGQTWTNMVDGSDLREREVLSVDATSPNGIEGCVAIRAPSPGDWSETLWFKDGVIVAMQWEDIAGSDPDEVYYPIGD